jgi:hypothetical protein
MSEKRQFFRIQQDVIFNFCPVSNDDMMHCRAEQHFEHSETLCLFSEFQHLNSQSQQLMAAIQEANPLIAEYLKGVNKKIDLVCQQVLSNQSSIHDIESGRIDISQGGIAFTSDDSIGVENWLALKLIFLPSYTGVITYGQVTRNVLQADGTYLIGVRFHNLDDEQAKLIAKQVFKTQIIERQQNYVSQH